MARFCRKCGSELGDAVKFCENCGAEVIREAPPPPKKRYCKSCGQELGGSASFCKKCGAPADFGGVPYSVTIDALPGAEVSVSDTPPAAVRSRRSSDRAPVKSRSSSASRAARQDTPPTEKPKKKKRVFWRLVAAVLAVVIVVSLVRRIDWSGDGGGGYDGGYDGGYGGYETGGGTKPAYDGISDMSFMPEYTDAEVAAAPPARLTDLSTPTRPRWWRRRSYLLPTRSGTLADSCTIRRIRSISWRWPIARSAAVMTNIFILKAASCSTPTRCSSPSIPGTAGLSRSREKAPWSG